MSSEAAPALGSTPWRGGVAGRWVLCKGHSSAGTPLHAAYPTDQLAPQEHSRLTEHRGITTQERGRRVGSVVRALDWRAKGRGFESRQEHKKNFEFFRVKKIVLTRCRCVQPPCIYAHIRKTMHARYRSCQSSVDYVNTNITSMYFYPLRRNVAAQVAEELKIVAYAGPPMEERRKKRRRRQKKTPERKL